MVARPQLEEVRQLDHAMGADSGLFSVPADLEPDLAHHHLDLENRVVDHTGRNSSSSILPLQAPLCSHRLIG
jgi:hypothetical protein